MNWWVSRRKIHTSWLVAIGCGAMFVGVFAAQYVQPGDFSSIFVLMAAILLIFIVFLKKYLYLMPVLVIGGALIGLWRGSLSQSELTRFNPLYGNNISIYGRVKDDVDIGKSNQIVIRLDNLMKGTEGFPGVLYITAETELSIKRGDELLVGGELSKGFGNFSGTIYRAVINKIVHPQPGDIARQIRDWFADAIRRVIPDPESSLGIGYLVGQRRSLPSDLVLALQMVGLTHVVVASGYNLTILVRLARRLFVKVSKYLSALSSGLMIVGFIAITGLNPSMARAGLVSGLSLLAWYYGRKFHPIVLLLIVVAITVMLNPSYAWGDLGWQLSFASFAGVMILAPLAGRYFFGDKKLGFIPQVLLETMSAFVVTAPIIISAFGQLSNVAVIANLLVLPLVPYAMLLTFIAGVGSLLISSVGWLIAIPATWLLKYMVGITEYLAALPWAVSKLNLDWWGVLIFYLIVTIACLYMWRVTKFNLREVNLVE